MANPVITNINNRANILGPYTKKIEKTIAQDASGVIPAGAVLGIVSVGSITAAEKSGGNTGNGTCTSLSVKDGASVGVYTVRIIRVGTHIFDFEVKNPNGDQIGFGTVEGSGQNFVFSKEIQFTLTDGSTDFIKGDGFDITVAAGSGKLKRSVSTAVDGSQYPKYVAVNDIDATAGDVIREVVYDTNVREDFLVFTGSETLATQVESGKSFRYFLAQPYGDAGGIMCITGSNITGYDNQ